MWPIEARAASSCLSERLKNNFTVYELADTVLAKRVGENMI